MSTSHTPFTPELLSRIDSIRHAAKAIQPTYEKMEKNRTYGFELAENIAHKFWMSKIKRGILDYLIKIKDNHAFIEAVEMLDGKELSEKRSLEVNEKKSLIPLLEKSDDDLKSEKKHTDIDDDVYLAGLQEIIVREDFLKSEGTLRKLCKGFHLTLDVSSPSIVVADNIQKQAENLSTTSESKMCLELCGIASTIHVRFKQKSHDQLKSEKETLETTNDQLKSQKEGLESKLDKAQKDLTTKQSELNEEKDISSARKTEIARLENEAKEKTDETERLSKETSSLRVQLSTQAVSLKEQYDEQIAAQKKQFDEQVAQFKKQIAEQKAQIEQQQKDIGNSPAREERLRRALEATQTEAKETKTRLEALNAQQALELKQSKSETDTLETSNERLKNKLRGLESINQRLQTEAKEIKYAQTQHIAQAANLLANLTKVEQLHEEKILALKEVRAENQSLQARIAVALTEISQLETQLNIDREIKDSRKLNAGHDSIVNESPPARHSQNRHSFASRFVATRAQPLPVQPVAKKPSPSTRSETY